MFGSSDKTVSVKLRADVADYKRGMSDAGNSTRNFGRDAQTSVGRSRKEIEGVGKASGRAASAVKGFAAAGAAMVSFEAVVGYLGDSIQAASDLEQTLMKSRVIFGANAVEIERWGDTAATNFGLSKAAAIEAAAGFGDMLSQLGMTGNEAAKTSTDVVQLAADLGSFNNLGTSEVLDMISASLRGEYDSLQRVIPNINAARVENEALATSGKKSAKELTAQEKATATLAIIQKDGARASGDFARSSGTLAIEQQKLNAQMDDLSAKLGEELLPLMSQLVELGNTALIPMLETLLPIVTDGMRQLSQYLGITQLQLIALALKSDDASDGVEKVGTAVTGTSDAAKGAARPTTEYKDSLSEVENKARDAAKELHDYNEALIDAGLKQLDARSAARDYQAALDGVSASIKENGKTLDINTEKGRANQDALDGVAEAANRQAQQILDTTGSQDAFRASLDKSRKDLYDQALKFYGNKEAARAYVDQVLKIPPVKKTKVQLDAEAAKRELDLLQQSRTIHMQVVLNQQANVRAAIADIQGRNHATGGPIVGPGTGTSDSIPAMLSNGEHVLTAAEVLAMGGHAAVERMRRLARMGQLPRFAAGGAVQLAGMARSAPTIDYDRLAGAVRGGGNVTFQAYGMDAEQAVQRAVRAWEHKAVSGL